MFTDVTALVVGYLAPLLPVPVSGSVPRVRPPSFVTVGRAGGAAANRAVDRPVLRVEVWAATDPAAAALASEVRGLLLDLARVPLVKRAEEASGPADDTPETGQARVTLQVRLTVRARRD